jgi:hypothetical protein
MLRDLRHALQRTPAQYDTAQYIYGNAITENIQFPETNSESGIELKLARICCTCLLITDLLCRYTILTLTLDSDSDAVVSKHH